MEKDKKAAPGVPFLPGWDPRRNTTKAGPGRPSEEYKIWLAALLTRPEGRSIRAWIMSWTPQQFHEMATRDRESARWLLKLRMDVENDTADRVHGKATQPIMLPPADDGLRDLSDEQLLERLEVLRAKVNGSRRPRQRR